jgi:hypothetical protein
MTAKWGLVKAHDHIVCVQQIHDSFVISEALLPFERYAVALVLQLPCVQLLSFAGNPHSLGTVCQNICVQLDLNPRELIDRMMRNWMGHLQRWCRWTTWVRASPTSTRRRSPT